MAAPASRSKTTKGPYTIDEIEGHQLKRALPLSPPGFGEYPGLRINAQAATGRVPAVLGRRFVADLRLRRLSDALDQLQNRRRFGRVSVEKSCDLVDTHALWVCRNVFQQGSTHVIDVADGHKSDSPLL